MTSDEIRLWAPAIAAVASAVAALAATVNVVLQNKNARRARAADQLLKREIEFDSPVMKQCRSDAAKAVLAKTATAGTAQVANFLNFMEAVAALERRGDVPLEDVWDSFHGWFEPWYFACEGLIRQARDQDKSVWKDLCSLHEKMRKLQVRRGDPLPTNLPADLETFLREECLPDAVPSTPS